MNNKSLFLKEVCEGIIENNSDKISVYNFIRLILFCIGFQLTLSYRVQVRLLKIPLFGKFLAKILSLITSLFTSCHISYNVEIAGGVCFLHPTTIVIGRAKIARNCRIYQSVTIGNKDSEEVLFAT